MSGHANVRRLVRTGCLAGLHRMFVEDRRGRMAGKQPAMMPVVAEDQWAPSVLPTPDNWGWFSETGRTRAASWKNEVTLRSVEVFTEYEPGSYVDASPELDSAENIWEYLCQAFLSNRIFEG